jgi:hypothetical protein
LEKVNHPAFPSSELAARQERCPQIEAPGVVHAEHNDSHPPDGRQPFDTRTPPGKVLGPPVATRVK